MKKCCTKEGKEGKGVVEGGTNQKVRHLKKGGTKEAKRRFEKAPEV